MERVKRIGYIVDACAQNTSLERRQKKDVEFAQQQ